MFDWLFSLTGERIHHSSDWADDLSEDIPPAIGGLRANGAREWYITE